MLFIAHWFQGLIHPRSFAHPCWWLNGIKKYLYEKAQTKGSWLHVFIPLSFWNIQFLKMFNTELCFCISITQIHYCSSVIALPLKWQKCYSTLNSAASRTRIIPCLEVTGFIQWPVVLQSEKEHSVLIRALHLMETMNRLLERLNDFVKVKQWKRDYNSRLLQSCSYHWMCWQGEAQSVATRVTKWSPPLIQRASTIVLLGLHHLLPKWKQQCPWLHYSTQETPTECHYQVTPSVTGILGFPEHLNINGSKKKHFLFLQI